MNARSATLALASFASLLHLVACSDPQRKEDEPVGRPPSDTEALAPSDSTQDDLRSASAEQRRQKAAPATDRPEVASTPIPQGTPDDRTPGKLQDGAPPRDKATPTPPRDKTPAPRAEPTADKAAPPKDKPAEPRPPDPPVDAYAGFGEETVGTPSGQPHHFTGEKHLTNVRKLTAGGQNAEAYFAPNGKHLIFQSTRDDLKCDQMFVMGTDGAAPTMVSTGKGATTCGYFLPDNKRILFASTHAAGDACPPRPDYRRYGGYVWRIDPGYDIYTAKANGTGLKPLAAAPGYDAEATISPRGDRIVFTSMRDGDLELYTMKIDGTGLKRLTNKVGYDGGAFFDRSGKRIVYRAWHPQKPEEIEEYQRLLKEDVVKPSIMEIWVMNADGSDARQITAYGAASFAPYFHPDGQRIIFASNLHAPGGRDFDLYIVRTDGTQLERVTTNPSFDSFPMFSPDGKSLVFASNRSGAQEGETNVFIADWKD